MTFNTIPAVTAVDLQYSSDNGSTWTSAGGNLGTGYNMCINPALGYLLDVNTMTLNPAGNLQVGTMNPFKLTGETNSTAFFAYWLARGVDGTKQCPGLGIVDVGYHPWQSAVLLC